MADKPQTTEAQLVANWQELAREASTGNSDAARDLLRDFIDAVKLSSSDPRDVRIPRPHAEYLAEALRLILDEDADPDRALGLRRQKSGRPAGGSSTHDHVALAAAYWLAIRRGRAPESAKERLRTAIGADRRTVERAARACSAFEDPQRIDEPMLLAILGSHPELTATLGSPQGG